MWSFDGSMFLKAIFPYSNIEAGTLFRLETIIDDFSLFHTFKNPVVLLNILTSFQILFFHNDI
jgi:hypothetical protein